MVPANAKAYNGFFGRTIVSDWRSTSTLVGTRRHRIEVRLLGGGTPGFALAVPSHLLEGDAWMYAGEDEETRRRVVGSLLARMQAAR